jgi:hypothetical protein
MFEKDISDVGVLACLSTDINSNNTAVCLAGSYTSQHNVKPHERYALPPHDNPEDQLRHKIVDDEAGIVAVYPHKSFGLVLVLGHLEHKANVHRESLDHSRGDKTRFVSS